ncbi:MAG: bifunctional UDP-N-acetylglucosamine diphosphorylase/glucosamine-1-phosphate N-acetyltransferase GlmU [Bacillota bacterium]|mgnify:CR=1 FL=1|jgi:bifunctional UDP-N-acetylglucosamine pyrophosphorylase/glucosamine-1-phosphate N-acetyltransferase|nr:bifunctional UDP-N-acetylglucosamine diphosphorylase/glucosamine-1-phosphate N-acetyltransferase GlmU [Bacillota bacterium]
MQPFLGVLLAAGQGKRMKSQIPKALHQVAGEPMIDHAMNNLLKAGAARIIVVVGHGGDQLVEHIGDRAEAVWQREQLGSGHATMQAIPALEGFHGAVVVAPADVPALRSSTIERLVHQHAAGGYAATVLTMVLDDPAHYGRVVRNSHGDVAAIVEYRDASEHIRAIREVNTGVYCFNCPDLLKELPGLTNDNDQGEYYLTDVIEMLVRHGRPVGAVVLDDPAEGLGINSREELAQVGQVLRFRKHRDLMQDGVTIVDPATTYIDMGVEIGRDTVIEPFTVLCGRTVIGRGCHVGPYVCVRDAAMGDGCVIGPFSYIRPGTRLADKVKVGDFVEVKNSTVGQGTKIPHLSYVGDADLGSGINVGAGTITCNYDGERKHRTIIEDGAFIGANSNLVAPVRVGREAYIATGSTITDHVPAGALGIARARQQNKEGWVERRKQSRQTQASREDN